MLAWLCAIVLGLAVVLGGGTHAGFLGDVVVQLLSVPLLASSLWLALGAEPGDARKSRVPLIFGCVVVCVIGIQLLPLPFHIWSGGAALTSRPTSVLPERNWAPLSLSPQSTWAAAASLIVPAALFFAAVRLNLRPRLLLTGLLLILGALALLLGFLQMAQGQDSALRFFDVTNPSEAVGFFANRNHFAAHLYVTLVLGAVWLARAAHQGLKPDASKSRSILWLTAAALFLVSVVAGLAMARSRAGVFLAMAALAGIVVMVLRQRDPKATAGTGRRFTMGRMTVITVLFAAVFAAQFGLGRILSRFEGDPLEDLRVPLAQTTFETALRSLPFGTGLGSFVPVYATVEKDKDTITSYANRAHNDLAELLLETGLPGALLLLAFLVWFLRRVYEVWLGPKAKEDSLQLLLQRAATLIIALLLAHSLVDYPLRTTALSAIFAFFCAILATDAPASEDALQPKHRPYKDRRPPAPVMPAQKWGSDLRWPESWQREG